MTRAAFCARSWAIATPTTREAFVQSGPLAIEALQRIGEVKFVAALAHPDYVSIRPGGIMVNRSHLGALLFPFSSLPNFTRTLQVVGRDVVGRLRFPRGTQRVMATRSPRGSITACANARSARASKRRSGNSCVTAATISHRSFAARIRTGHPAPANDRVRMAHREARCAGLGGNGRRAIRTISAGPGAWASRVARRY
jgi:hypothetical protein